MKSKVLLIDDSVTIHRVIDLSIDFDRYDIVKVFSKEDAALKLQSEQFDYILLDNKLDNIIISEYISELKQQQKKATIILLVGAFDRFDETDLEKTKADDYLVKPFDSQSLNEKLSSEVDMMPAGIVERIAEADFARDNDDYIKKAQDGQQETSEAITKKEYLDNLEEVQIDDLTDKGYVEELDQTEPASMASEVPSPVITPIVDEAPASMASEVPSPVITPIVDEAPASMASEVPSPVITPIVDEAPASMASEVPSPVITPIVDEAPASMASEVPSPVITPIVDEAPASMASEVPSPVITPIEEEPAEEIPAVKPHVSVPATDDSTLTAVNNMVSLNDLEEDEDNEDDGSHIADDLPLSSIELEEPLVVNKSSELMEEQAAEEPVNVADDEVVEHAKMNIEAEVNDNGQEEGVIEMPNPITAVHSPILPGIDDAATISDDYLMQENLAPVDNNEGEMLQEFPDFPDIDDASTDEMQDLIETAPADNESVETPNMDLDVANNTDEQLEISVPSVEEPAADDLFSLDNAEVKEEPVNVDIGNELFGEETAESPVEEQAAEEKPLFEDDDWLSDAPAVQNEPVSATEALNDTLLEEDNQDTPSLDFGMEENNEPVSVDIPLIEESAEEQLVDDMPIDNTLDVQENIEEQAEEMNIGISEDAALENEELDQESNETSAGIDTMSFFTEEDGSNNDVEDIDIASLNEEESVEESPVLSFEEDNTENTDEQISLEEEPVMEEQPAEESLDFAGLDEKADVNPEPVMPVAPVMNAVDEAATTVKEAQEYKAESSDRFGGITVTISRDEIMKMLGNAIDKYFLEEAVKEVIAANMKDIVRNIVPAIAEKYIKEEIERLKNDE